MTAYNPTKIEPKWQRMWEKSKVFVRKFSILHKAIEHGVFLNL